MHTSTEDDKNAQKIWDLIKDAHSALLVTKGADGRLDSRPMGCVQTDFEGTSWCLTFAFIEGERDCTRRRGIDFLCQPFGVRICLAVGNASPRRRSRDATGAE